MDRLKGISSAEENRLRIGFLMMFFSIVLVVILVKYERAGFFVPKASLIQNNDPQLLFFNRYSGCDCVLEIYEMAQGEILAWPESRRSGVELVFINLDKTPQLGRTYGIVRAPTLILLDENGGELLRQENSLSYDKYFDLERFEQAINQLKN